MNEEWWWQQVVESDFSHDILHLFGMWLQDEIGDEHGGAVLRWATKHQKRPVYRHAAILVGKSMSYDWEAEGGADFVRPKDIPEALILVMTKEFYHKNNWFSTDSYREYPSEEEAWRQLVVAARTAKFGELKIG